MHIQPSGSQSKGQVGCKHFKTSLQRRVLTFPASFLIPWYRSFWCEMHWTVGLESRIPVSHGGCSPCFLLALIHCQSALEAVWRSGKKSIFTRLIKRRYGVVRKREDKWFWFTEKPFSDTSRLLMETGRDRSRGRQQWLMQRPLTHNSCFLWIRLEKKKRKKKSIPPCPARLQLQSRWVWSLDGFQTLSFWPHWGCPGAARCHCAGMRFPCAGTSLANTRYPSFLPAPMVGIIAFGFSWLWKASKELSSRKLRVETESRSPPHLFVVIQLPPFTLWHNNGLKVKQEASSPPAQSTEWNPASGAYWDSIETNVNFSTKKLKWLTQKGIISDLFSRLLPSIVVLQTETIFSSPGRLYSQKKILGGDML